MKMLFLIIVSCRIHVLLNGKKKSTRRGGSQAGGRVAKLDISWLYIFIKKYFVDFSSKMFKILKVGNNVCMICTNAFWESKVLRTMLSGSNDDSKLSLRPLFARCHSTKICKILIFWKILKWLTNAKNQKITYLSVWQKFLPKLGTLIPQNFLTNI